MQPSIDDHLTQIADLAQTMPAIARKREMNPAAFMPDIARERAMLWYVAEAAKEMRLEAGRGQVEIAAAFVRAGNKAPGQSTITRFENHQSQPKQIDATIAAYAEELDVEPQVIWKRAAEMWDEAPKSPDEVGRGLVA